MSETKTKDLTTILSSLGIEQSTGSDYLLVLYNDDVNDIYHVIKALFDICELNENDSMAIVLEAHTNGKAVAKKGDLKEMSTMKKGLNSRFINAEVEENE